MTQSAIKVFDNFLAPDGHAAVWNLLSGGGWSFGAVSDSEPDAHRYFFKHFAGYVQDGAEPRTPAQTEAELRATAPLLANFWDALKAGPLRGHGLGRCYANGMPPGAEGGVHQDSNIDSHLTAIYYPHPDWNPSYGGETLLFNADSTDIVGALYPKPNRLAIFPGAIPHVARPLSMRRPQLRITLMFKTTGEPS
jgi:SM-20-related protein